MIPPFSLRDLGTLQVHSPVHIQNVLRPVHLTWIQHFLIHVLKSDSWDLFLSSVCSSFVLDLDLMVQITPPAVDLTTVVSLHPDLLQTSEFEEFAIVKGYDLLFSYA
jgi:hypothetical protein